MKDLRANKLSHLYFAIALSLSFGAILIAGCAHNDETSAPAEEVPSNPSSALAPPEDEFWMQNLQFNPLMRTVSPGATVTWRNIEEIEHTVTSGTSGTPTTLFESGVIEQDSAFQHTFDTAGTYSFFCRLHPETMQGTVVVQ